MPQSSPVIARPSGLLYSWASLVGLSRVHAYKHYLSDVIVGAVAGVLMAELFYNLGETQTEATTEGVPVQFIISIPL